MREWESCALVVGGLPHEHLAGAAAVGDGPLCEGGHSLGWEGDAGQAGEASLAGLGNHSRGAGHHGSSESSHCDCYLRVVSVQRLCFQLKMRDELVLALALIVVSLWITTKVRGESTPTFGVLRVGRNVCSWCPISHHDSPLQRFQTFRLEAAGSHCSAHVFISERTPPGRMLK